jgi:hypothetical protein
VKTRGASARNRAIVGFRLAEAGRWLGESVAFRVPRCVAGGALRDPLQRVR